MSPGVAPPRRAVWWDGREPRGHGVVDLAVGSGCGWVAFRAGAGLAQLREVAPLVAARGLGAVVFLDDTRDLDALHDVCAPFGTGPALDVPMLRDRLVIVADGERMGRRLRGECRWAPSALDLGASIAAGLLRAFLARRAPNLSRAQADCDDLVVPATLFPPARAEALARKVALRGGRVWIRYRASDGAASAPPCGVFGVISGDVGS